jgi:hypothetical protein
MPTINQTFFFRSSVATCTVPVELVTMKAENELASKEEASGIDERVLSA